MGVNETSLNTNIGLFWSEKNTNVGHLNVCEEIIETRSWLIPIWFLNNLFPFVKINVEYGSLGHVVNYSRWLVQINPHSDFF